MKIIHTADLHLGNVFHQHSRTAEHQHFLDWLRQTLTSEAADALIISGDVFDTHNPSAEAQRMLFDFLLQATEENEGLQIVVVAGNHDAGARLEAA
ncbi:MAG: exonuclease subunit SbcD, partial [Bacteroidaceae bacterium]|nr:exonuclease subunit SbcD [Bacteroidaceae bacterium]